MANFCPNCTSPVDQSMNGCPNCGARLPRTVGTATAGPAFGQTPGAGVYAPPATRGAVYPKASLGGRFVALLIDGLVGGVAMIPGGILIGIGNTMDSGFVTGIGGLLMVAAAFWMLWYTFTKDGRLGGQSIGKRMMGLMVVHLPTNEPCTYGQSAVRAVVMLLLNCIPAVGWLVEPIVAITAADGRRFGDRAADTQVIGIGDYRA